MTDTITRTRRCTDYTTDGVRRYEVTEIYTRREVLFEQQDALLKAIEKAQQAKQLIDALPRMILPSAEASLDDLTDCTDTMVQRLAACAAVFDAEFDRLDPERDRLDDQDDAARRVRHAAHEAARTATLLVSRTAA